MKWHVFLTPMHIVEIDAEQHDQVSGVHRFASGGAVIAEFQQCLGWMQVIEGKKETRRALTLVSNVVPPSAPTEPAA